MPSRWRKLKCQANARRKRMGMDRSNQYADDDSNTGQRAWTHTQCVDIVIAEPVNDIILYLLAEVDVFFHSFAFVIAGSLCSCLRCVLSSCVHVRLRFQLINSNKCNTILLCFKTSDLWIWCYWCYSNTFKRWLALCVFSCALHGVWRCVAHGMYAEHIYRPHSIKCVLDFVVFMLQVTMNEQVDGVSALQHNSVCSLWAHTTNLVLLWHCSVEIISSSSSSSLYICTQCTNDTIFMANWMRYNRC